MQVATVVSEIVPFSKTGGLGDVAGALPATLSELGTDVFVITPFYRCVRENAERLGLELEHDFAEVKIPVGDWEQSAEVIRGTLPNTDVTVYLLNHPHYYDRPGLYVNPKNGSDHEDNSERFVFLSRAAVELCCTLGLQPDVFHCHDWQTGLVPIYLKTLYRDKLQDAASVFTVHNIEYQGIFWHRDMKLTGLDWSLFNWRMLEYYGNLCFLKAGMVGGDAVTTVSKNYAKEIQTERYGAGLHGVATERSDDLFGIVNGVDYNTWDPRDDELIPCTYSADDLSGKRKCKRALQEEFDLAIEPDVPVIGMITRLANQKGLDLLEAAVSDLLERPIQLALLGTGEPQYHDLLREVHAERPEQVGIKLYFSEQMAHCIEAGSDMLLMPSRYEPCGLNQLYSLRYGTVPIVRQTGGLADTIVDYQTAAEQDGEANGFGFKEYKSEAMLDAVDRALQVYRNQEEWRELMLAGMRQDWSWRRSAREYLDVYEHACTQATRRYIAEDGSQFCTAGETPH